MDWGSRVTYLASTALKERVVPFGIKDEDRLKHLCVLGKVGSGRASMLARMALQDVERGIGVVILDASGNLGPTVMERLDGHALEKLVHLDAADAEYPFSWSVVDEFRRDARGRALFLDAFASVYNTPRSALTDYVANYVLDTGDATLMTPYVLLTDEKERDARIQPESDAAKSFAVLREAEKETVSKLVEQGRLLFKDTMVRNLIAQREGKFSLNALQDGGIVIVDLSRIRVFPTRVAPLVKLFTYATRAQSGSARYSTLYLHDCLRYYTESDADALLQDQSYALTLSDTLYRESDLPLRERTLSRCGSVISFEPHQSDVSLVQRVFYPYVTPEELAGLEVGEACVALTIDAVRSKPFFANALELPERRSVSLQDILVTARKKYTKPRTDVDQQFKKSTATDKKDGTGKPPFNDAFKNIFAKRDPSKALELGADKKPTPDRPKEEPSVQPSMMQNIASAFTAATGAEPVVAPQTVAAAAPTPVIREIAEDELRALLHVSPLPT